MARLTTRIEAALDELERDGTLSAAQRAVVGQRVLRAARPLRGIDLVAIVAGLGALLVGAGLLYLLGDHWLDLARGTKLALVFALWGAVHVGGYALAERPGRYPRVGRALTLLGVLAFGGATVLVAQMYHLAAHHPHAVLAWWVLSIPIALVTRSRAVLAAVIGIALLWSVWQTGVWVEDLPLRDARASAGNLFLVGLAFAPVLAALATLAAGGTYAAFAPVLRGPVLVVAILPVFVLAFHEPWWSARGESVVLAPAFVAASVAFAVVSFATWRRGARATREAWMLLGALVVLAATALLAPRGVPVAANALVFGGALLLAALGVREGRSVLVTTGVLVFVLGAVARYFEYLFARLEGAYAFLATGVLLLGAAFVFENRRRALVRRAREGAS